jgi:signal transduction histidine kinase
MLRELGVKARIIAPIVIRGQVEGTITLATAESRRRYSQDDVRLAENLADRAGLAIENARLYAETRDAVKIRERILAVVSHDLRNQLGVVSVRARLIARQVSERAEPCELTKSITTIQRTAETMQHLVGDLLDMATIQTGQLSIEPLIVPLKPLLDESWDSHEPIAVAKNIRLQFDRGTETEANVLCDRRRIVQVLANLLGNAIKFCTAGDSVTLRADVRDHEVVIAVTDTGPGIPHGELEAIFEPYRSIRRRTQSGTGLGLYIAKGIVERHGGRIHVDSQLGVGTTFSFTLPRH